MLGRLRKIKSRLQQRPSTKNQKGMTLVEIMIVLAILGGLIAVLSSSVVKQLSKARIKEAKIQMSEIGKALDMFYTDCGFYPQEGLNDLLEAPSDCKNWGPDAYLPKMPKDPWSHEFEYENSGGSFILRSLGQDGREGGEGEAADISSEDL